MFLDLEGFCLAEIAQMPAEDHWLKQYLESPQEFVASPPRRLAGNRTVYEQLWRGFLPEADSLEQEWIGDFYRAYLRQTQGIPADTGLACSLQTISTPRALSGHPLTGALFESAVMGEIRKLASTLATPPNLYHWRSLGGGEVDILLERDGTFYPIETKPASKPERKDTRGIAAFRETYPKLRVAPGLVIAPVERMEQLSETEYSLPWDRQ